jgi:hypothetical protein
LKQGSRNAKAADSNLRDYRIHPAFTSPPMRAAPTPLVLSTYRHDLAELDADESKLSRLQYLSSSKRSFLLM